MDEVLRRGYKRLGKLGHRLGINEREGIPWFQFYDMIKESVSQYLPVKYRDYEVQIKTVNIEGREEDVMRLWKEGAHKTPDLPIRGYTDCVVDGADPWKMLGKMADDYKKLLHPNRKYQQER